MIRYYLKGRFFEAIVKYDLTAESGRVERVKDVYLFDAFTFTDAEAKTVKETECLENVEIVNINPTKYDTLILSEAESEEKFYKCKVNFVEVNEDNGKKSFRQVSYLLQADSLTGAKRIIEDELRDSVSDYEIASIGETKIVRFVD